MPLWFEPPVLHLRWREMILKSELRDLENWTSCPRSGLPGFYRKVQMGWGCWSSSQVRVSLYQITDSLVWLFKVQMGWGCWSSSQVRVSLYQITDSLVWLFKLWQQNASIFHGGFLFMVNSGKEGKLRDSNTSFNHYSLVEYVSALFPLWVTKITTSKRLRQKSHLNREFTDIQNWKTQEVNIGHSYTQKFR